MTMPRENASGHPGSPLPEIGTSTFCGPPELPVGLLVCADDWALAIDEPQGPQGSRMTPNRLNANKNRGPFTPESPAAPSSIAAHFIPATEWPPPSRRCP